MPRFLTQYNTLAPNKPVSEPGSPVKTLYGPVFDNNGVMDLQEIGRHNLYDEIQSHADSVDIHVLLKMYERDGDESIFSRIQGAYGDFTSMPKTFAEALNTMIAAEQYFNGLPVETRAKFGHSFSQFLAGMDSPSWASDIGIDLPTPPSAASSPQAQPDQPPASPPPSSDS
ncbi:internal scaffolding protein [Dipodfec virus UOA04_Rod_843]|nr:internal scaffolding protein [Dipodfec virus UOA04_Rod_843]